MSLQSLYPDCSQLMRSNLQQMMPQMWTGLTNSALFANNAFTLFADPLYDPITEIYNGTLKPEAFTSDASLLGAMLLFMDGVIPETGSLAINASNERYFDTQTNFPTSEWNFNYAQKIITIPVNQGVLQFNFGTAEPSYNFTSNAVYTVQFSDDWNSINNVTKIASITTLTLQPVTLQKIQRSNPAPSPTPTTSTLTVMPAKNDTISPTATPSISALTPTATAPIKQASTNYSFAYAILALACIVTASSILATFKKKIFQRHVL